MAKGANRAARIMRKRESQLIEGGKNLLVLRGTTSSETIAGVATDLAMLKKPNVRLLTRKNDIHPMEDASSLEFLLQKNDCSAFLFSSHSKKRPDNLVLGRSFDDHILDMIEIGVVGYASINDFPGSKKLIGSHPCFVFTGDLWDREETLQKLRSLILDVFSARDLTGVSLAGLDHVISLSADSGMVHWRTYSITLKRSDGKVPRVELSPMGPHFDLVMRRTQFASPDLARAALRQPKENIPKKEKNVATDVFGETMGRIHMEREDFSKLHLSAALGLGKKRGRAAEDDEEGGDADAAGAAAAATTMIERDADEDGGDRVVSSSFRGDPYISSKIAKKTQLKTASNKSGKKAAARAAIEAAAASSSSAAGGSVSAAAAEPVAAAASASSSSSKRVRFSKA